MAGRMDQVASTDPNELTLVTPGLSREFGFFPVFLISLSCLGLASGGHWLFSGIASMWPGVNLLVVLAVGMIPCVLHAYSFSVIGAAVQRSGADYYLTSRSFSSSLAFASSWTFVIFSALVGGALVARLVQTVIPVFFRMFGLIGETIPAMIRLADTVATPENVVTIGTVFVVIVFGLVLMPPRFVLRTLQVGVVIGLIAWGLIIFVLATSNASDFPQNWERVMGPGSYLNALIQARSAGMNPDSGSNLTLEVGLFIGFWLFSGYTAPIFAAGEVKKPSSNLFAGSALALLVAGAILILSSYLLLRLVPAEWLAAESFLGRSGVDGDLAMPWLVFYAVILRPGLALAICLFLAWILAFINMVQVIFFYCSRVVLSWVDDGMMFQSVGRLHPGLRSPLVAVLLVASVAEFGLVFSAAGSSLNSWLDFLFYMVLLQLTPILAVIMFPFTQRSWFQSSNRFVRLSIGPLPVISLVGTITVAILIWVLVMNAFSTALGELNPFTALLFLTVFVIGLLWHYGWKRYQAKQVSALPQDRLLAADQAQRSLL